VVEVGVETVDSVKGNAEEVTEGKSEEVDALIEELVIAEDVVGVEIEEEAVDE
jgi:hypothetical protein